MIMYLHTTKPACIPHGSGRPPAVVALALLPAALLAAPTSAIAQSAPSGEIELPAISVEGGWLGLSTEGDVRTYPGARTLVTAEEIRQSGAKTIEDVLRKVPGVQVFDETGVGILPNIGVRGLNPLRSERALVLVNGVPVAPGPYTGTGLSLFPVTLETVDRIDVVRGGAAVHFGPNNIGGVINIITKEVPQVPSMVAREKLTFSSRTANVLSDTYMSVGGPISDQAGLQLQGNLVKGATDRDHSEVTTSNFLADWYVNFTDRARVRGQLQYYNLTADLPGALSPDAYRRDPTQSQRPFDAVEGETVRGSLRYEYDLTDRAQMSWTTFGHILDRQFTFGQPFDPSQPATSVSTSPRAFDVYGTEPQLVWRHDTFGLSQKLTLGARYIREEVDFDVNNFTFATNTLTPVRQWNFATDGYAAYISNSFGFLDDRLNITPGIRFENVETDFQDKIFGFSSSNHSQEWLPGLAIGYQATDEVFLFANMNKSLRPPQVAQVTRGGAVGSEVARVYEVGARLTPFSGAELTMTAFRFNYDDQIEFDRARQLFVNLGETRHQGIEVAGRWQPEMLPGLDLSATYTFTDAEQLSGPFAGKRVPFSSEHLLNLGVGYRTGSWTLATSASYQSAAFSDAANSTTESADGATGPIPEFWVWNAQATYTLASDHNQTSELGLSITNILDNEYYFRGVDTSPIGRVPGPGRSVSVSYRATF